MTRHSGTVVWFYWGGKLLKGYLTKIEDTAYHIIAVEDYENNNRPS